MTGFGLLGHGLEMARGSRLRLVVRADDVPLLSQAAVLAERRLCDGRVAPQLVELWRARSNCRRTCPSGGAISSPIRKRQADF